MLNGFQINLGNEPKTRQLNACMGGLHKWNCVLYDGGYKMDRSGKGLYRCKAQKLFFKLFFTDAIAITQSSSLIGTITVLLPLRGVDY